MIYILNFYFIEFFSWISNKYFPVEFSVLLPILARRNLEFCFAKLQTTKRAPYLSILYLQSKSGLDILIMVHIHGSTQLENYSKNVSTNKLHNDDHIGATREHLKFNYQPRMTLMQFWLTFILACFFFQLSIQIPLQRDGIKNLTMERCLYYSHQFSWVCTRAVESKVCTCTRPHIPRIKLVYLVFDLVVRFLSFFVSAY